MLAGGQTIPAATMARVNVRDPVPLLHNVVKGFEPWSVIDTYPAVVGFRLVWVVVIVADRQLVLAGGWDSDRVREFAVHTCICL